jgi:transcriptional regulator with XRE-family HTH domain
MITSAQIRAARALLHLDQRAVAANAGVSVATLRRAEAKNGTGENSQRAVTAIQHALEAAGAEFIPNGVRRQASRSPEEIEERLRAIAKISEQYLRLSAQCPDTFLTEDDLYDENGLPA